MALRQLSLLIWHAWGTWIYRFFVCTSIALPAVLQASDHTCLFPAHEGVIEALDVEDGSRVSRAVRRGLLTERDTAYEELATLRAPHDQLTITAPHDGVVVDMTDDLQPGRVPGTNAPFFIVKPLGTVRRVLPRRCKLVAMLVVGRSVAQTPMRVLSLPSLTDRNGGHIPLRETTAPGGGKALKIKGTRDTVEFSLASKRHNSPCQTVRSVVHLDANAARPLCRPCATLVPSCAGKEGSEPLALGHH